MDEGRGLGKIQPKHILPKESFQIRARTWASKKALYCSAAPLSQKIERAPASGFISRGCRGNPLRLFASGLSLRESLDPRPGQGRGTTSQGLANGTASRRRPTERQRPALAGLCLPVGKLETGKGYGQLPPKRARSRWKKEAFSGAFWAGAGGSGWWREVSIKTSWQSSRGWPFWGSFRR